MGSLKTRDAVLIDTNVLIDYIDGYAQAQAVIAPIANVAISVITWIEVMSGVRSADEEERTRVFLESWEVVSLSTPVAALAAELRRERRLKLPDSVILASARHHGRKLVTRNSKDFDATEPDVVVPYQLSKPARH